MRRKKGKTEAGNEKRRKGTEGRMKKGEARDRGKEARNRELSMTGKGKDPDSFPPAYLRLFEEGTLQKRSAEALAGLETCQLCPRNCRVNRLANEAGICRTGRQAVVDHAYPQHIRKIGGVKLDEHAEKRDPVPRWVVERTLA